MKRYHRANSAFIGVADLLFVRLLHSLRRRNLNRRKLRQKPLRPVQTFVGVISDGQCAVKGSHKEVMAKAKVNTAANCVKGCARRYGYVLYVPSTKKIYKLSDQERPAELAARKVRIKGALDKATQTIYVSSIEPVL